MSDRPPLYRLALRGTTALVLTYAAWLWLTPAYNQLLAVVSEPAIRLTESRWKTDVKPEGSDLVFGSDILTKRGSAEHAYPFRVKAEYLHWNIFLFLTLAVTVPGPSWGRRILWVFGLGALLLLSYHVLGLVLWTKRAYAYTLASSNREFAALTAGTYTVLAGDHYELGFRGPLYDALAHFHSQWGSALAAVAAWGSTHYLALRRTHAAAAKPVVQPGRNDPCPCGSGKKYKHCHGLRENLN